MVTMVLCVEKAEAAELAAAPMGTGVVLEALVEVSGSARAPSIKLVDPKIVGMVPYAPAP
jgi:hypothetical protein